jgi:RNA polymerase sigma factor (TIGR02999 family)
MKTRMIDIRDGDRGPFVAAIQILVNRWLRSTQLHVDGIWGSETRTRVAEVNRRIGAPGGGERAGAATWAALIDRTHVSIISANDIYDPRHDEFTPPELRGPSWIASSGMSGGVGQVVRDIEGRTRTLGPIALLRFFGHGAPGLMGVTGGTGTMRGSGGESIYRDSDGRELERDQRPHDRWGQAVRGDHVRDQTTISNETFRLIEPQLARLRGHFAPYGSVELHGCRLGLGSAGRRLLRSVSDTLGVPASAGRGSQSFGQTTSLRFEGSVQTMFPKGGNLHDELRSLAAGYLNRERPGHTLQPTALVHEAYVRMVDMDVAWQDRAHFFALSARLMRRVLVDHARSRSSQKRGGGVQPVTLEEGLAAATEQPESLMALDDALTRLAEVDERKAKVVELHYFGGLSYDETAAVLDISAATVDRDLRFAKSWLLKELADGHAD